MTWPGVDLWGRDLRTFAARPLVFSPIASTAGWHQSSRRPVLALVLQTLPISHQDSILDIGCGRGGAIITMAQYPFARIDGVEISPDLAAVAERNLARLGISRSSIRCCNAA